jgi:hypothetical protein
MEAGDRMKEKTVQLNRSAAALSGVATLKMWSHR